MADVFETKGGVGGVFSGLGAYLLGRKGPSGFGGRSTAAEVAASWSGSGKVAIITGAATGIGFESACVLASRGAEVILTARDLPKASSAADKLRQRVPDAKVVPMALDLSSFASVRSFAKEFLETGKPLNILLNNAGVMACPFSKNADGHELQLAVNHFAHFLLTHLLLDKIVETARSSGVEGRVVNVASSMHWAPYKEGIRVDTYNDEKTYQPWGAYGQSKLANVLFTRSLAERLKTQGAPVTALTLHPGAIPTELQRHMGNFARALFQKLTRPLLKSIPQGAATQVLAATAPGIPSGEFLKDCNLCASSALSHDKKLAEALWQLSEKVTGVKG